MRSELRRADIVDLHHANIADDLIAKELECPISMRRVGGDLEVRTMEIQNVKGAVERSANLIQFSSMSDSCKSMLIPLPMKSEEDHVSRAHQPK